MVKCFFVVLLMSICISSSGQNLAIDSLPANYNDTLFSIEQLLASSRASTQSNDSLGHTDDKGRKQGIWVTHGIYVGNCTNSISTDCNYYKNDQLLMSFSINHDNNACYPSHTNFICRIYNDDGMAIYQMNNVRTEETENDYLWTSLKTAQSDMDHWYQFTKVFFEENLSKKRRKKMKLTYRGKKIPGDYQRLIAR